jgi:hypothetical protein
MLYSLLAFGGAVTVVADAAADADADVDDVPEAEAVDDPLGSDCGFDDVQATIGNASVMTPATSTRRLRFMCFPFV